MMTIYNSLSEIKYDKNRTITVGSFDGVHRGHLEIIKTLTEEAAASNTKSLLITFEPHPQLIVKNPLRSEISILNDLHEKIEVLSKLGLDELLVIPFTTEFSQITPENFILDILNKRIGISKILIGYDHLFGKDRKGDYNQLLNYAKDYGFKVDKLNALTVDDMIISSTEIRKLIKTHQIEEANILLGYNYSVSGEVVVGNQLGNKIGFPTVNIKPDNEHKLLPARGVYLAKVTYDEVKYWGMANIGLRPTLTDDKRETLEINIFDFDENIYHKRVKAEYLKFIRQEVKFEGVDKLIEQLKRDKENCIKLRNMFL